MSLDPLSDAGLGVFHDTYPVQPQSPQHTPAGEQRTERARSGAWLGLAICLVSACAVVASLLAWWSR